MTITLIYDLVGIMVGMGGLFAVFRRKSENKVRHAVALERNTEATERLTTTVEKLADVVTNQDKRLDKLEWKVFGV